MSYKLKNSFSSEKLIMISIKKVTEKIVTFFLEFLKNGLSEKPLQALITVQPCPSFHIVKSYVHFVGQ